jgi:hypothetical protein
MVGGCVDEQPVFKIIVRLLERSLGLLGGWWLVGVHGLVAYRNGTAGGAKRMRRLVCLPC